MEVSVDDLLHSSRTILQKLNGLRIDHNGLLQGHRLNEIEPGSATATSSKATSTLRLLMLGMEDASTTAQLIIQMQHYEADRQRARMQVQRLSAENKWLREELGRCRGRLVESEQSRMKLEVQIEHYKFCQNLDRKKSIESDDIEAEFNEAESLNNANMSPSSCASGHSHNAFSSVANSCTALGTSEFYQSDMTPKLRTLHNLVVHYASVHRYDVAVPLCRQTLEDLEKTIGRNHPDVATMLNILALVYRDQNKYSEASQLLKEALAIREHCLGQDNPAVAATLNNLAVLQGRRGKYKDAETLCNRALAIRIKNLGADHADVAKQLVNLGLICLNQAKYGEALSHYERAITIYRERLGEDDAIVLRTQISLAGAQIRAGKLEEAESLLTKTIIPVICPNTHDDYSNGAPHVQFDSHLLITSAKACLNLFKSLKRLEDVAKVESLINSGSPCQIKELVKFLRTLSSNSTTATREQTGQCLQMN